MRTCRSGRENVTNDLESGERVMHVGIDFALKGWLSNIFHFFSIECRHTFLNSYKSVELLNDHMPGIFFGNSKGSVGCQNSTNPFSSAEITVSYRSLY